MPKFNYAPEIKIKDLYKYYKEVTNNPVSASLYGKILFDFFAKKMDYILHEGGIFHIPAGMGMICVTKNKFNIKLDDQGNVMKERLLVDWKKTWELWGKQYPGKSLEEIKKIKHKKVVYLLNEHTDSYVCAIRWVKGHAFLRNKLAYSFLPMRRHKRNLAKIIKSKPSVMLKYYEIR